MKRQASGGIWTQFLQTCGPILYSLYESISFKALANKYITIVLFSSFWTQKIFYRVNRRPMEETSLQSVNLKSRTNSTSAKRNKFSLLEGFESGSFDLCFNTQPPESPLLPSRANDMMGASASVEATACAIWHHHSLFSSTHSQWELNLGP